MDFFKGYIIIVSPFQLYVLLGLSLVDNIFSKNLSQIYWKRK